LLPMLRGTEPLESMGRTGGFREEMEIRITNAGFAAIVPLGYTPQESSVLERALKSNNMRLSIEGNLLSVIIPFDVLDRDSLIDVRERLALARQLYDTHR